ncbi:MAG: hypothetical protein IPG64_16695 [Haliea sp.]|nr:hypothetical protein [Haliea sp.]
MKRRPCASPPNGYPQEMLFAFEYNTALSENPIAALDAFIDTCWRKPAPEQVYAVATRAALLCGRVTWTTPRFPARTKVALCEYRRARAGAGGVPTIGIWGRVEHGQ